MPALGWFARELLQLHIQAVSHDMAGNVDSFGPPVNTFCHRSDTAASVAQTGLTLRVCNRCVTGPAHDGTYAPPATRSTAAGPSKSRTPITQSERYRPDRRVLGIGTSALVTNPIEAHLPSGL